MSKAISRRRGTTAEHAQFTGLDGELTVDTTKKVVVVHDGQTAGGHPMAREDHLHAGVYTPKTHESDPSAHPELAASDEEVDARTGSKFLKVGQLARAVVKSILDILPITLGGTGASTVEGARANLGLGSVATEDVLPLYKGGTGATTASAARDALNLGDAATRDTVSTSSGAADTGKIPALDATGKLALGFIPTVEVAYVPEAGHAVNADAAITAQSADTATTATSATSATNADKVDGYHAHKTPNPNTIPVADGNGKLDAGWFPTMQADTVDGFHAAQTPTADTIPVAGTDGKLDMAWLPSGLDAALLGGRQVSLTKAPNTIPAADASGVLDASWFEDMDGGGGDPAGYVEYTTPGTYTFTVPEGVTGVFVDVHGAGGAGATWNRYDGGSGGSSSFGGYVSATGGGGGSKSNQNRAASGSGAGGNLTLPYQPRYSDGAEAKNTDDTTTLGGAGSVYGTGGAAQATGTASAGDGGRGAGGGGKTYGAGGAGGRAVAFVKNLTPGQQISVVVGAGGTSTVYAGYRGGYGGPGIVRIWW